MLEGKRVVDELLVADFVMFTRRRSEDEADSGLVIATTNIEWLRQMADVHNFGNVRKTLADVVDCYLKWLSVDNDLKFCLKAMRRNMSTAYTQPLRQGCISTEHRGQLFKWAGILCVSPSELLDASLMHATIEGDEEELFENLRVHENTMSLYMDLQMGNKILVEKIAL